MGWSVCTVSGCPELSPSKGKCHKHKSEAWAQADAQRGNRHARGYGSEHVKAGTAAIAGATHCDSCGEPFTEDNPAQRGHRIAIRDGGTASDGYVAHCRRCNLGWRKTGL